MDQVREFDNNISNKVLLWIGSNNIEPNSGSDLRQHFMDRIMGIIMNIVSSGKKVIVMGYPTRFYKINNFHDWTRNEDYKREARALSTRLMKWARKLTMVEFIKLPDSLYAFDYNVRRTEMPNRYYTVDGIHLTREGYRLVAQMIHDVLREM